MYSSINVPLKTVKSSLHALFKKIKYKWEVTPSDLPSSLPFTLCSFYPYNELLQNNDNTCYNRIFSVEKKKKI